MDEEEYSDTDEGEDMESETEDEDEGDLDEDEELDMEDEAPLLLGYDDDESSTSEAETSGEDIEEEEEWGGFGNSSGEPVEGTTTETHIPTASEKPAAGMRYVPPHLRNRQADSGGEIQSEEQIKLTRQLKGLLNRCVCAITTLWCDS